MPEISERLASIEANYIALDRRAEAHEHSDNDSFDTMLSFVMGMKKDILAAIDNTNDKVDALDTKVGTLWDDKNKREGAFGLSKLVAGTAGGLLVALMDWFVRK